MIGINIRARPSCLHRAYGGGPWTAIHRGSAGNGCAFHCEKEFIHLMRHFRLRRLLFLALCCDFGLFAKQLVSPFANLITDALHIPGGIGTSFSLMFLVIAVALVPHPGCATVMGTVQSMLALVMGRVGSMGVLSPIGYIVPGVVIDLVMRLTRPLPLADRMMIANALGAVGASLTANWIVFRLWGAPLALYACVAATSGALCGLLGSRIVPLVTRAISFGNQKGD